MNTKKKKKSWVPIVLSFARDCKGKMVISVICAVISVFGSIVPYYAVFRIITAFIEGRPDFYTVLVFSAVALAGYGVKTLFHTISTMLSHISAYTILKNIRTRITRRLMKAPLGAVQNETAGKMKNIILDRVEVIELPLAHIIPEQFSHLLLPIAIFTYVCFIDWRMALAALITVPIAGIVVTIMMKGFNTKYAAAMKSMDHVNSVIVEYVEGIEVIKAFGRSAASYEKFSHAVRSLRDFSLAWYKSTWPLMNFSFSVLPVSLLGCVPVGIALYLNGSLTPSEFAICLILSLGIVAPMLKFTTFVNDLKAIEYAVNDADTLLSMEELPDSPVPAVVTNYDIELTDVSFSYDGTGENDVLRDLNLKIPQGSFSALVGPSGSGKSTMARLMARFWDVRSGRIAIGGTDIRAIPLSQLMDLVCFVTQDNFLFDCTLKENIRLGNPEADDDQVLEASKAAQCHEFISVLDKGYETPAGEAGNKLSGGEKQRIAIARAILKDAPIILLDEATAFTDPENEEKIQKSLSALTKDKTLLVVAHRLSTITNADQIILVNEGEIVQVDTHEQLLASSPLYASMWHAHINAKSWSVGTTGAQEADIHV